MTAAHSSVHVKPLPESSTTAVLKTARYLGILAALVAVGWCGHQTHWTFRPVTHASEGTHSDAAHATEASNVTAQKVEAGPTAAGDWKVTFPSEHSMEVSGISTAPLQQKPIAERVRTTGVITYDERISASLSARTTGTVWRVCKHVGEAIKKGDVLVVVDAAEVGQSKSEFLSALVALESKTEILTNLESIASGAIPQRQVREAKVAMREAKIRLLNAEQTLLNMGFNIKSEDYQALDDAARAERIRFLGLPDTVVEGLQKMTSNLLPIKATFDGIVLRQDVALGETAEVGKPILEIADIRRMWLKLDVPKEGASQLALGQQVTFNPDGVDKDLHATITWISTEMNQQTRTLQIRAEVDNPVVSTDPQTGREVRLLRANTFGTGTIILRNSDTALVVPVSAILHDDRQALVFAKTDKLTFERVNVSLGVRDGSVVELVSGDLKPGSEIVVRGGHVLKSEWTLNHVASAP
ncbi:MAG: heavy metal resistance protein CzcB [Schlesneria sp.]|nr:heavy metal resistance protein CzcB [Schlesneria sp.]